MNKKTRVWIGLGSNLGDSRTILQQAWQGLGQEKTITLVTLSSPYVTEPVGMESEYLFLNAIGILETSLAPESFLTLLQRVELGFGRNKKTGVDGYQDRLLDLDILYYGEQKRSVSDLILPHPHIADRLFVLAPLTEIDPDHCDPLTGKTAQSMQRELLQRMKNGKIAFQEITRETWA